jgi:hypothetical protein
MPEVPYTGVIQGHLDVDPIAPLRPQVPPQAFGINVAEAIGHLGTVEQGAGKEMFDRAYALQEFKIHADANSRLTGFQNEAQDITSEFLSKQGANASPEAFNQARQRVDAARTKWGQGTGPFEQQLYDNESRMWQFRLSNEMASHTGQQLKVYNDETDDARIKANSRGIVQNPSSDDMYEALRNDSIKTLQGQALTKGWSKDKLNLTIAMQLSDDLLNRVHAMADTEPQKAKEMLARAISNKDVSGDRVDKELGYVNEKFLDQVSRNLSAGVMSGAHLMFGEKIVDAGTAQIGIKAIEGGNYTGTGPEVAATKDHPAGHGLGAYQVMTYNLDKWLDEAKMPPMSAEAFLADRSAQDKLFNIRFGQYMERYGSFNRAAKAWFSGNPDAEMDKSDRFHTVAQYLQIANHALAKRVPLADINAETDRQADMIDPGNEPLKERAHQRNDTAVSANKKEFDDTEFHQSSAIFDAINNGVGPNKTLPTSVEEVMTDPAAKQALEWYQLNDPKKLSTFRRAWEDNAKGDVGETEERSELFHRLKGMGISTQGDDRRDFLAINPWTLDLPRKWKGVLSDMQAKVRNEEDAAPQVPHALQVLGPMINKIGLKSDADNYNLFKGTLHQIMTDYQIQYDKPMSDEEIQKAGTRLFSGWSEGGWFGGGAKPPWFETGDVTNVPPEEADIIRRLPNWGGANPSDDQVLQMHIAREYMDKWAKAKPQ